MVIVGNMKIYKIGEIDTSYRETSLYKDNLARQQKENKRVIDKMERYVKDLIAKGVDVEVAQALGQRYYLGIKKKIELVKHVRLYERKKVEKQANAFEL